MTQLDQKTIQYLANLSRIAVSESEEESLLKDLKKIIAHAEQLNEVDTSAVAPCTYVIESAYQTPLREDRIEPTLTREIFLKGTPQQIGGMVRVPPVMKQES